MRCGFQECNAKIKLAFQFNCRCGIMYCRKHSNKHNCSFDYKTQEAKRLTETMPKVIANKVNKI